jgi:D-sedoheptulose 7-phosphate isomerase
MNNKTLIEKSVKESIKVKESLIEATDTILLIAQWILDTIDREGKILLCGNGGSAADSQHIACELVGKLTKERQGLPAIALTTDTSILTAVSNDWEFDRVFSRQVEALGKGGDLLIAISTSGKSKNILQAVEKAREKGIKTVALTGFDGGALKDLADLSLVIPSRDVQRIQEAHITVGHILSDIVEQEILERQ